MATADAARRQAVSTGRRFGDLGPGCAVQSFDFHLRDLDENDPIYGLGQRGVWLYGGYRTPDGQLYVLERKYVHQMTGGLWMMSNEAGALELLPEAARTARGELRREMSPDRRIYRDQLMAKLGKHAPEDEIPLMMELTDGGMVWQEGELIDLKGVGLGPGLSMFVFERDWPMSYIGRALHTTGTIRGEPVEGVTFLDHGYWVPRREWKEEKFYGERQICWHVFWTEFEDGTHEWGQFMRATGGVAAGMVATDTETVAVTGDVESRFTLDDQDYVAAATHRIDDIAWEFTADPAGQMLDFSAARWGEYRAQAGVTQRVGETRPVKASFTWLETFCDRMRSDGLAAPRND